MDLTDLKQYFLKSLKATKITTMQHGWAANVHFFYDSANRVLFLVSFVFSLSRFIYLHIFSIRRLYWLLIQTLQDKFTVGKKKYINSSFWKRKNFENIRHRQMLSGPLNAFTKFRVYQHICPFRIESQSFCFHMSFDFIAD